MIPAQARSGGGSPAERSSLQAGPAVPPASHDPLRKIALFMGMMLLFLQVSMLHQLLHVNLYLLYLFGIPAIFGMVMCGGLVSSFRGRPAYYWTAFMVWMLLAVPFSSWPGGSAAMCFGYLRTGLVMLFVIAGLVDDWRGCKLAMSVIAAGAVVNIVSARLFRTIDYGERMGLEVGTVSNPNDYAGHLLLVLPFLLWIGVAGKFWMRIPALVGVAVGCYLVVGSGSRGASLALIADVLFIAWKGVPRQKIALALLTPLALAGLLIMVPASALRRIGALNTSSGASAEVHEALESSQSRTYVLKKSAQYALQHPVFGVGPGQFPNYEGQHERVIGTHGSYHEAHNTYTQTASECGIPGFLFFVAGIVSSFRLLNKTFRQARMRPDCQDIRAAAFYAMLGMIGFCAAITFLNFAYFFYLPAMGGLAIAISSAAQREFRLRQVSAG